MPLKVVPITSEHQDMQIDMMPPAPAADALDICQRCENITSGPCPRRDACANARRLTLELCQADAKQRDVCPRGHNADFLSGWQHRQLMVHNDICDRLSGRMEAVMVRVAGVVRS